MAAMAGDGTKNGSEPSGTELDRFQALVKKLVSVPKAEIEAARKRDQTKRAQKTLRPR